MCLVCTKSNEEASFAESKRLIVVVVQMRKDEFVEQIIQVLVDS